MNCKFFTYNTIIRNERMPRRIAEIAIIRSHTADRNETGKAVFIGNTMKAGERRIIVSKRKE